MSSTSRFLLRSSIATLLAVPAAGCGSANGGGSCVHDEDCASNFCRADGTCAPASDTDASVTDSPTGSDDGSASGACTPNHDGMISAGELPLIAGRSATFRVATNATIDTAGTANGDGSRTWSLTAQLSGDADDTIALASPAGAWWQGDFASATYAVPLSASSDLLGVFEVTDTAVNLLGVVSPDSGGGTELTYDPPAQILKVPFGNGATWTSTSTVSGTASGVFSAYTEKYASRADEVGTMTTPYGGFPVIRVATDLTRTEGLATLATNRTFSWNAECFGAVATIQSQSFETGAEFTDAAEVRRLSQ